MNDLQRLFYPQAVLLYGISESASNLAKYTLMNLENFGFAGDIYLLGSKAGTIGEKKIVTTMEEIDKTPDLAIILVPARMVPRALEDCGKKGITFAVIQSGGFSEFAGAEGKAIEEEMLAIAQRYRMRFAGPNCIGLMNLDNGLVEPFFPVDPHVVKKGSVALVAQSGGIAMDSLRFLDSNCIGFNKLFSIGNKLNLNEGDYLSFLQSDAATEIIAFYLESFQDGRRFARLASEGTKPIACLKSNRVPLARQIASFHTTALAGDDAIASSALKQAGVLRVDTLSEMMDFFKLAQMPPLRGRRIGVICRSGGQAVTFADAVGLYNFQLADFSDDLFSMVRERVRAGVIRLTNPLDLGDVLDTEFYTRIMEKAVAQDSVDGLVFGHVYLNEFMIPETEQFLRDAQRIAWEYNKPIMIYIIANKEHYFRLRSAADFPLFTDENRLMSVLSRMYECQESRGKNAISFSPLPMQARATLPQGFLEPHQAYGLLQDYGVAFPAFATANSTTEVLLAGNKLGYPVALKIGSSAVLHKTEKKGVVLNLHNEAELQEAATNMATDSFLIQKMTAKGTECFIGAKRDPEFGPVLFFGMGGIFVELLRDVATRIAPLDEAQALEMILETKVARLLQGFRGLPAGDIRSLAGVLVNISRMIFENPNIKNLDINPIMVFPEGQGCAVVDIKVEIG
ncbi:MAG: acetate--CoA ligase family protein [Deltaproteobacteria bacterium]|nr:acetate--CoA ligase family protein [Deltaproteobacteria bacterium]